VLSIAVLDNMSSAAESKEKEAQDKRLLHVLEVRYGYMQWTKTA